VRVDVVTIFPGYLEPLRLSLIGKARDAGLLDVRVHDLREHATDRHRTVDDTPYGGGAGMVLGPEPWAAALDALLADPPMAANDSQTRAVPRLIVPTPGGRLLTQSLAEELACERWLAFACGRYEGIDRRVLDEAATLMPVDEVSIGDYVLGGGEAAVLVIVEAVARLLPGVIGNTESLAEESHNGGLLEYPVYTKPANWRGRAVPEVLLSGNHAAIARWRRDEALRRTALVRPDLLRRLDPAACDRADLEVLAALGWAPGPDGVFSPVDPAVSD
jgi:tRNA (guanine37-N1)-methyltransferase